MKYSLLYRKVLEDIDAGLRAAVVTKLGDGGTLVKTLYREADIDNCENSSLVRAAYETGALKYISDKQGNLTLAEPYFPQSRLIVFGGGHIAKPLVEFSARCGFAVTVVDDRPSFANKQRFPLAERVICEGFDRCFKFININRSSFVVIITRGHRHDLDCLRNVLGLETAYTGMIGSKKRVRAAREQLLEEGYSKERLDAVRAPIGLDIGAQTPEEIAVSILSELIYYKRKLTKTEWPELDTAVLTALTEEGEDPRALVTIIETKGSVPRDAGAKMIVWPYGRTLGSIGGGCSESDVIQAAYDVIRDGGYKIVEVDMTGRTAEDEGMVCGGRMKVLIEKYE
ncbi:MAG: xanthine dehydrogenase [Papillibacter sp.]|nr:xanthine dehydrogenase [Papillibacter sp.]